MIKEFNLNGKKGKISLETDADLSVFEEIFVDRDYKVLNKIIGEASVILDLGAHIGCFSIYAGVLNSGAKIFSFEPEERNFALLKENLKLNNVNAVVKNVAIGGVDGNRELYLSSDSHNHSLIGSGEGKKVFVRSFDGLIEKLGLVDLVKMDIEGAEFEIFENVSDESLGKIRSIYIEYHEGGGRGVDSIVDRLRGGG